MMHYKNTKAIVYSPDGDRDFFNFVAGVFKEDTFAPYFFIIYLAFVLQKSIDLIKENKFRIKKGKKQTISYRKYNRRRLCR